MRRLGALLPGTAVVSSTARGIAPLDVEALAFAWLARKAVRREPLDLTSTTGAKGPRILGAVWPA
jgi:anhydro-N-acetylmuramic acid kinase